MNDFIETGASLYKSGRVEEAEEICRQGLSQDPSNPTGHFVLGLCRMAAGNLDEAAESFRRAISLKPQTANYHYHLGIVLERLNRPGEAQVGYTRAIELNPNEPIYHAALGELYKRQGDTDAAIACFQRALQLRESPFGLCSLSELLLQAGRHSEAEVCARRALAIEPHMGPAHELLGMAMEETGRFPDATAEFTSAYGLQPEKTFILYRIARCRRMAEADRPFVDQLERLADSKELKPEQARYVEYSLGKVCDDLSDFESAITHYDKANALSKQIQFGGRSFPKAEFQASFDAVKRRFTESFFKNHQNSLGLTSERPVFIVGMIRSGTTLLEHILSCHRDIAAAGEVPYWLNHPAKSSLQSVVDDRIDAVDLQHLARRYLDTLHAHSGSERRVTDKMPNNYMALGLVHLLFPNARIIHARRNPIDNCLSIYTTVYSDAPKFAYERKSIVAAYRLYEDLMAHWSKVIPANRLLTVDYEDMVSNREETTMKMVEFCGLEWDDKCLRPEANPRSVSTPSLWQVRQPIYRTSIDRWKNYEPWLGEFAELQKVRP